MEIGTIPETLEITVMNNVNEDRPLPCGDTGKSLRPPLEEILRVCTPESERQTCSTVCTDVLVQFEEAFSGRKSGALISCDDRIS